MLNYYLFQKKLCEDFFEVAVIAKSLSDAKKYLAERYRDAKMYDMVFFKPAEGMVLPF